MLPPPPTPYTFKGRYYDNTNSNRLQYVILCPRPWGQSEQGFYGLLVDSCAVHVVLVTVAKPISKMLAPSITGVAAESARRRLGRRRAG